MTIQMLDQEGYDFSSDRKFWEINVQTYIYGITEHFYNFSIFHIVFFSFRVTSRPLHQGRELNGILQWQADLFIIPLWTWVVSMDILYKRVRETRRSKYLKGCLRQSLFFAEILGFYILKLADILPISL